MIPIVFPTGSGVPATYHVSQQTRWIVWQAIRRVADTCDHPGVQKLLYEEAYRHWCKTENRTQPVANTQFMYAQMNQRLSAERRWNPNIL